MTEAGTIHPLSLRHFVSYPYAITYITYIFFSDWGVSPCPLGYATGDIILPLLFLPDHLPPFPFSPFPLLVSFPYFPDSDWFLHPPVGRKAAQMTVMSLSER